MDSTIKRVVSMLANDRAEKTTLFTETGEIIELRHDGPYEINKLSEYLTEHLTGTQAVEIDLVNFTAPPTPFSLTDLAAAGIQMTTQVNGKSVQGIFYPDVAAVEVTVGNDKVIIPHVENLQAHMARAAADGSPSVINFFKRLAPVIQARKHSGEDLMKFIRLSEMPLTNTGRIIAYKRVRSAPSNMIEKHDHVTTENIKEFMVDSHSRKILQRVGSRVTMPVDMVDPSRHNSCSTGLHVANLGYIGGFTGDKTIIVLVDPENFIAVPHGEDTKARVCSYDIVGVMDGNQHNTVCQGSHVDEDVSFSNLIIEAVEGRTITPFEEVMVGTKEIKSLVPIKVARVEKAPSKNPTTGKSLASDPKPEETKKALAADVAKNARTKLTSAAPLEEQVLQAFRMLKNSKTKAEIARFLETSTRSVGRWIEKFNFASWVDPDEQDMEIIDTPEVEEVDHTNRFDVYYFGGMSIDLIKAYRTLHGSDLRSSKEAVEKGGMLFVGITQESVTRICEMTDNKLPLQITNHGAPLPVSEVEVEVVEDELFDVYYTGTKSIALIKTYRLFHNSGLKESIEACEMAGLLFQRITQKDVDKILKDTSNHVGLTVVAHGVVPDLEPKAEPVIADLSGKATVPEQARMFFEANAYAQLWAFKTKKKKSWSVLGFNDLEESVIIANKPT